MLISLQSRTKLWHPRVEHNSRFIIEANLPLFVRGEEHKADERELVLLAKDRATQHGSTHSGQDHRVDILILYTIQSQTHKTEEGSGSSLA